MKLGAEPKKVATVIGLFAVAGVVYWMNSSPDAPSSSSSSRTAADPVAVMSAPPAALKAAKRREASGHASGLGEKNWVLPDNVDPTKVDPIIRLDLFTKVQAVGEEGGVRNIFQIGQPPPPPAVVASAKIPKVDPLHPNAVQPPPQPLAPPAPAGPPPTPPPAPITLKYYGYSTKHTDGEKKAFFLDGDDIIVAAEGEIIKKQYKVLRINLNSVQVEDTASKSTQTLPLQLEAAPA